VIAARSRFTFGIDALDATIHQSSSIPDGKFISWLGQFQYARILKTWDMQLLFRTDAQVANQPLLPLEQIAVGGRYTVRGYREDLLVRDQALISSLELRVPIVQNAPGQSISSWPLLQITVTQETWSFRPFGPGAFTASALGFGGGFLS